MEKSWWQTITIALSIFAAAGFIWLNVPSNSDFNRLEDRIDKIESKIATKEDINRIHNDIENLLDEIRDIDNQVRTHSQNFDIHNTN